MGRSYENDWAAGAVWFRVSVCVCVGLFWSFPRANIAPGNIRQSCYVNISIWLSWFAVVGINLRKESRKIIS